MGELGMLWGLSQGGTGPPGRSCVFWKRGAGPHGPTATVFVSRRLDEACATTIRNNKAVAAGHGDFYFCVYLAYEVV